jgi:hypothetical protein
MTACFRTSDRFCRHFEPLFLHIIYVHRFLTTRRAAALDSPAPGIGLELAASSVATIVYAELACPRRLRAVSPGDMVLSRQPWLL